MAQYLHLFETENEFQSAYTGENYDEPWVSYTEETEKVDYNKGSFNIRVAAYNGNDELVYNDSFSKSLHIGHLTSADFYDSQWYDWAQSVYYNEHGYGPVITNFPPSLYTNDQYHLFRPLGTGSYENDARISVLESDAGATVNEGAMNRTFTVIMRRVTVK